MSTKFKTGVCRAHYVHVFQMYAVKEGDKPARSIRLLIPKSDSDTLDKIKTVQSLALDKKFGNKRPGNLDLGLRDGDEYVAELGEDYADHFFINVKNYKDPVGVIDRSGHLLTNPTDIVDGDYVKCTVDAYGYDNKSKGVAWGLRNVMFWEKGDPMGHFSRAEDDFADDLEPATTADDDDDFM